VSYQDDGSRQKYPQQVWISNPTVSIADNNTPEPQNESLPVSLMDGREKTIPLPPIYSGIGLGVYSGDIVVSRLMAIGEKRWVVNNLQFDDLRYLPLSLISDLQCLINFLRLIHQQSAFLKKDLQTQYDIKLMQFYLRKSGCQCNSPSCVGVVDILSTEEIEKIPHPQGRVDLKQNSTNPCAKSNIENNANQ
jgi:hypothetical protein